MIRIEISDDSRCQLEVKGNLGRIAFEFARLTSHLAANMPEELLKQAFEDGLYINEYGMEAFGKKMMVETIEEFKSEESETEDVKDDDDSDRGKFKDFATMTAAALAAAALLGGRNDKTGKH